MKMFDNPLRRYRLGTALIWLAVLTWAPFIVLRIAGEKPSLFLYLPFHLVGVMGGARLRASAHKEMDMPPPKKSRLRVAGHGLIFLGILVWAPYFYLKMLTSMPAEVMDFLPYHLTGVLGGVAVLGINHLADRKKAAEE
jgi:hypothetical protein